MIAHSKMNWMAKLLMLFFGLLTCASVGAEADSLFISLLKKSEEKRIAEISCADLTVNEDLILFNKTREFGYSKEEARRVVNLYSKDYFPEFRWKYIAERYAKFINTDEIRAALEYFESDGGLLATEHFKYSDGKECSGKIMERLYKSMAEMMVKREVVKEVSSAPKDYQKKFRTYLSVSGQLDRSFSSVLNDMATKKNEAYFQLFSDYMGKNMTTLMIDASYPVVTLEDLQFMIDYYSTSVGKKIRKGNALMLLDASAFEMEMQADFETFLKEYSRTNPPSVMKVAPLNEKVEDSVNG